MYYPFFTGVFASGCNALCFVFTYQIRVKKSAEHVSEKFPEPGKTCTGAVFGIFIMYNFILLPV